MGPRLRVYTKEDQACFNSCAALLMLLLFLRRISGACYLGPSVVPFNWIDSLWL